MSNLGFGGKLIAGGVDAAMDANGNPSGSLIPTDYTCHSMVRAGNVGEALGPDNGIAGGWNAFNNSCGDDIRQQVISALQGANNAVQTPFAAIGFPTFQNWPVWNDITHQKMWVDWIRRARDGGQRVMVALAVNNKTLGDAVVGPGDVIPTDDMRSADLQLSEMKAFVARHNDFMEVALSSADLDRIVRAGKLAVVLGVEIDNIGNLKAPASAALLSAEAARLYNEGVRYIFPIHVIDNAIGGTAVYEGAFNTSNYREAGHFWSLACSAAADGINYQYTPDGFDLAVFAAKAIKLGVTASPPPSPACATGHQNALGLTSAGADAIRAMMKLGMMIDIDHMSQRSADAALGIAEAIPGGGYPLNSGHTGLRAPGPGVVNSENTRSEAQLRRIAALHGMFGQGTAGGQADQWLIGYDRLIGIMTTPGAVTFGTDLNGLVDGPRPRPGSHVVYDTSFPISQLGGGVWDYNRFGVAHYGLMADFVRDMQSLPLGHEVDDHLNSSAEYFFQMWSACETQRANVP
jgi:microsomal dipeptidase-like Zn-dependent dipeptidase